MREICKVFFITLFGFTALMPDENLASQGNSTCNSTVTERVHYEFNTDVVNSEHIISYKGYFIKSARENYISAALKNVGVFNWTILTRNNPANEYPSDFDVVMIREGGTRALDALRDHPAVRCVTAQRQVMRTIKYVREDDCGDAGCLYSGWRNHKARKMHSFRKTSENGGYTSRKLLRTVPRQITSVLKADVLWSLGVTGEGIKVAVFDTGLARNHPHFGRVRERTDWTGENTLDDTLGHGTFVAGVIGSRADCLGFAPDADLHIFRVFTDNQINFYGLFTDNSAGRALLHILDIRCVL